MKEACVMLVRQPPGGADLVLAVQRKGRPDVWGLPGGKREHGEGRLECAVRELREETGLLAHRAEFVTSSLDEDGYLTSCYSLLKWEGAPKSVETPVAWVTWQDLLAGPWPGYIRSLMNLLDVR